MVSMVTRFLKKIWVPSEPNGSKGYWSEYLANTSEHEPFPVRANRASKIVASFSRQEGTLPSFGSNTTISVSIPLWKFDLDREDILKLYMQSNKGGSLKVDIWLRRTDGSDGIYLFGSDLLFEKTPRLLVLDRAAAFRNPIITLQDWMQICTAPLVIAISTYKTIANLKLRSI
jgi:hypothetical protein